MFAEYFVRVENMMKDDGSAVTHDTTGGYSSQSEFQKC